MHERDRRRTPARNGSSATSTVTRPKPVEPDFTEHKSYKLFVSKKLSWVLGTLFLLTGLFGCVDYFGPKTTSHETVLGFPSAANVHLIRTDKSYFVIDPGLQYETTKLHSTAIDVEKSLITKTPLSFSLPQFAPGEKFYPLSTRYSHAWLFILTAVAGLVLFFYPKYDFSRIYIIFFATIIFFCAVITTIALQAQIDDIYDVKTIGW